MTKILRRTFVGGVPAAVAGLLGLRASEAAISEFRMVDPAMFYPGVWIPDYSNPGCCPVPIEVKHGYFTGEVYFTGTRYGNHEFARLNPTWVQVPIAKLDRAARRIAEEEFRG